MENTNTIDLSLVIKSLMEISSSHSTESNTYTIFEGLIKNKFLNINNDRNHVFEFDIGLKKNIKFPFIDFGSITSLHLFGLDELIIFAFYILNKKRYNKVADLGANVGLHSIIMQMCGWKVAPYEPDPIHVEHLNNNFKLNDVTNIRINQKAVSDKKGNLEFTRVVGNTTGSHLTGSKPNPYGALERFIVEVEAIGVIFNENDFIKLDVEGHEKQIILSTNENHWKNTDMIAEISSAENANFIYNHLKGLKVNCFSQIRNWSKVENIDDMPISYKDGSVFFSKKEYMPWI